MTRTNHRIIATGSGGVVTVDGADCVPGIALDGRLVYVTVPRANGQSASDALFVMARAMLETAEARKRTEADRIKYDYRNALESVPGATVTCFESDPRQDGTLGGFILQVHFPNGYGVSVVRNGLSYGGECIAMLYRGEVIKDGKVPQGTDIPEWNEYRTGGPDDAADIARQVDALPDPTRQLPASRVIKGEIVTPARPALPSSETEV